MSRSTTAMI